MSSCPPVEVIDRFLGCELSGPEQQAVTNHLETCLACRERLDRRLRDFPGSRLSPGMMPNATDLTVEPSADFIRRLQQSPPPGEEDVPAAAVSFPEPPTPLGPLGRLHSYHVCACLGTGSTSVVFKAHDEPLDRPVALKVLRPELAALAVNRSRFEREARAAAAVRHEHVVAIHHVGCIPGSHLPYLVLEYVEGESLSALIRREGKLPPQRAALIARQVALGLAAAHAHGLVHRDIKPSNLLLDRETGRARIVDFGLARAVSDPSRDGLATQPSHFVGTPAYMSPEQVSEPHRVGPASDVYSLGVVLYEMLTGRPPFTGSAADVLMQVIHREPPAPRAVEPAVPAALETITLTCLSKEPGLRYATAKELADDLERWLNGDTIQARRAGALEGWRRWARRNPAMARARVLAGVALLLSVLLGALCGFLWLESRERTRRAQEEAHALAVENARLQAGAALDHGVALCERGQVGQGMTWLAHGLELVPDGDADLDWAARMQLALWQQRLHPLRRVLNHEGAVYAAAFSPDGRTFVTGGEGRMTRLWDAASGELLREIPERNAVVSIAFSPNGRLLLIGDRQGSLRLWEVDGRELYNLFFDEAASPITAAGFSPDGQTVLAASLDGTARLWSTTTLRIVGRTYQFGGRASALAFSPDGLLFVTGHDDGSVHSWNKDTGEPGGFQCSQASSVTSVAFSPDGRTLLTACKDHAARLWDVATGQARGRPFLHKDKVYAAVFSPDGKRVLTGSKDRTARLWDVAGAALDPPLPHAGIVHAVSFAPDGRTLLTASADGSARLWGVAEHLPVEHRLRHTDPIVAAVFAPDGASYLTSGEQVRRWDTRTGTPASSPLKHFHLVTSLLWRPGGQSLFTASSDGTVRSWDRAGNQMGRILVTHQKSVNCIAVSPDDTTLLTGSEDLTAQLWDVATGQPRSSPLAHRTPVIAAAFSPDGTAFCTGAWDGAVQLWDTATCAPRGDRPLRHRAGIVAVAFSPDGRRLLSASRDSTAQVWDLDTLEPVGRRMQHEQPILAATFSPDGRMVLSGGQDRTARLWEAACGRPLGPPLSHFEETIVAVAFSPDGGTALVVGSLGTARLWPLPTPAGGTPREVVFRTERLTGWMRTGQDQIEPLEATAWPNPGEPPLKTRVSP